MIKTENAAMCQNLCRENSNCFYWTYATTDYFDSSYHKDCYLKADDVVSSNQFGLISGPKNCGQGTYVIKKNKKMLSEFTFLVTK